MKSIASVILFVNLLSVGVCVAAPAGYVRESVTTLQSQEGENQTDFMLTVGRELREFTDATGNEACGAVGFNASNKTYAVKVYTDGVSIGCAIKPSDMLAGFEFTGDIIHSHPHTKILKMREAERAWAMEHNSGTTASTSVRNDGASGFSRVDYAYRGGSWLVAGNNLLRKDENGKSKNMGRIR